MAKGLGATFGATPCMFAARHNERGSSFQSNRMMRGRIVISKPSSWLLISGSQVRVVLHPPEINGLEDDQENHRIIIRTVSAKSDPAVPAFRLGEKRQLAEFAHPPGSGAHPDPDGDPRQAVAAAGARAVAAAAALRAAVGEACRSAR